MGEWKTFRVGTPSTSENWTESDCRPLSVVSHVAHIDTACDIVRDGKIRAGLIFDKCKLNKDRILVTWLSPNDWGNAGGFRYGNVKFSFDFADLVAGKNYYWVESIAYGIVACRILITSEDRSQILDAYDPESGDGPWWFDSANGVHYWNGDHCLEVMFEGDVPLSDSTGTAFVKHHKSYCNVDYSVCPDRDKGDATAGAEFISRLIARGLSGQSLKLSRAGDDGPVASWDLVKAARHLIIDSFHDVECAGDLTVDHDFTPPIARAIISSFHTKPKHAEKMAEAFATLGDLQQSLASIVAETFGVEQETIFDF